MLRWIETVILLLRLLLAVARSGDAPTAMVNTAAPIDPAP